MRRTFMVAMMIAALVMSTMAAAVAKGGPHDKATGTVYWSPSSGPNVGDVILTSFDAHDGAPGAQADRGTITTTNMTKETTSTITLDCVIVEGNEAWLGGYNQDGQSVVAYVKDDAQPGGTFNQWTGSSFGADCTQRWSGPSTFLDGNVKVHYSGD